LLRVFHRDGAEYSGLRQQGSSVVAKRPDGVYESALVEQVNEVVDTANLVICGFTRARDSRLKTCLAH
jgi:hypothetical protein